MNKLEALCVVLHLASFIAICSSIQEKDKVENISIKIMEIEQPGNCTLFLDNLEILMRNALQLSADVERKTTKQVVRVDIPEKWDFTKCGRNRKTSFTKSMAGADIEITGQEESFGSNGPWVVQHKGCGEKGFVVRVSEDFFTPVKDVLDHHRKGQQLSMELLKYKYGVYSEHGYNRDPVYPQYYSEGNASQPSTGCANAQHNFCPVTKPYNRLSPTKQNMLCAGKSALEVITGGIKRELSNSLSNKENDRILPTARAQSKENRSIPTPYASDKSRLHKRSIKSTTTLHFSPDDPLFIYTLSLTTKYRVVLDQTAVMGDNLRWTNIRRSMHRFIDLLPVGSVLSVLAVGESVKEVLPSSTVTDLNRDGLYGRIPRRVTNDLTPCIECALNHIASDIGDNEVVIVITGDQSKVDDAGEVFDLVEDKKVPIFLISYPASLHTSYLQLAKYGGMYAVVEGSQELHPRVHLQEILMDILRRTEDIFIEKIHQSTYKEDNLIFGGEFTFKNEKSSNMRVTLNVPDEEKVEYFELVDPNGKKEIFSEFEDGMVYFKFSGILPLGIWTYKAKLYKDTVIPENSIISVDAVLSQLEKAENVIAKVFTNINDGFQVAKNSPVKLFARIMKNGLPVLNADATVQVFMPTTSDYSIFPLHDNGLGYPDITSGDGIYSAYLPGLGDKPGYYSVRLVVTSVDGKTRIPVVSGELRVEADCCGSMVPSENETATVNQFKHTAIGYSFYKSTGVSILGDQTPPNRISDLKVSMKAKSSLNIQLKWTAPGKDQDFGTASKYDIRCHTNRNMLSGENFSTEGIQVPSEYLPKPQPYGTVQSCIVGVPWPNEPFYFAIVAEDDSGNKAMVSNIVSVYIHEEVTTTAPTRDPDSLSLLDIINSKNTSQFEDILNGLENKNKSGSGMYIAGGIMSGIVTVIVFLLIIMIIKNRRKGEMAQVPSAFPISDIRVRQFKSESPTLAQDSKQKLEKMPKNNKTTSLVHGSKLSLDGSSKVLLTWLEALPTAEQSQRGLYSGAHVHGSKASSSQGSDKPSSQFNTLTRSPHRHRMLTNGSFKPLREATSGSDSGSAQLTTSTLDESHSSDSSNEFYNNYSTHSVGLRRSNTSATLARGSSNTGFFSVTECGAEYTAATLGRVPRVREPVRHGVSERMSSERVFMPAVSETDLYYPSRTGRRVKRTESFV